MSHVNGCVYVLPHRHACDWKKCIINFANLLKCFSMTEFSQLFSM